MFLGLPAGVRPVVRIERLKVRVPEIVLDESQFLELRNCKFECGANFQQACVPRSLGSFRDPFKNTPLP